MERHSSEEKLYLPGIEGKVAIVTGGAIGIGKEICNIMAELGAIVFIIDIEEKSGIIAAQEICKKGKKAYFINADVSNEKSIQNAVNTIVKDHHRVDILVNNAGISKTTPFENITMELWEQTLKVNLTGTFICSKAVIPVMLANKSGTIVMVSSGSAITGSGGGAHYAATKGGMNSLCRAMSRELAPKGIRVNGVAPRTIDSPLYDQLYSSDERAAVLNRIPVRRLGTMQDIAYAVAFLSSSISDYIAGETLLLDGGRTYGG